MSTEVLQNLWYIVVGLAIVAYVVLDGFDLGVGCLHLFARNDHERRIMLNSIGPVWDGNEVWLIIIAGALFAGFPDVYAGLFSGFYLLFMIMLAGIMFRAVAIEFRSKAPSMFWRSSWDFLFSVSSILLAFLSGLILGNLITGVPVDQNREIWISLGELFTLYPMLVGVFSVLLLATHGHHFILLKTEGETQEYFRRLLPLTLTLFTLSYFVISIYTWLSYDHMTNRMMEYPLFYFIPVGVLCSIIGVWWLSLVKRYGWSFIFSCFTITLFFMTYAVGIYPNLIISSIDPSYSLTLYNAAAQDTTLKVTLTIVIIGIPLVLGYFGFIYYIFRHKTKLHEHSY